MQYIFVFANMLLSPLTDPSFLSRANLGPLALQMGSGVILCLIARRRLFALPSVYTAELAGAPLVGPLTVPAIAVPSALATVQRVAASTAMPLRGSKVLIAQVASA